MSKSALHRIDQFLNGPSGRADNWRDLVEADAGTSLALATRITHALMTRSFRQHGGDSSSSENVDGSVPDLLPPAFGRTEARRPYFETLIVTGVPATSWQNLATEWRRMRRPVDAFIYEPMVGSLEDAFCAAMLNPNIAAVVINEGFALRSRHDAPVLRSITAAAGVHRVAAALLRQHAECSPQCAGRSRSRGVRRHRRRQRGGQGCSRSSAARLH